MDQFRSDLLNAVSLFFSPIVSAILAFGVGYLLYWIKDRDPSTREFDRQTKRLQLWKTFYDLQAVVPVKPDVKFDERCKLAMERAVFWVEALPTVAHKWARRITVAAIACITLAMFFKAYSKPITPQPPFTSQPPEQQHAAVLALIVASLLVFAVSVHVTINKLRFPLVLTQGFIWLAEHVTWLSWLKHTADL
jgi:hypothetical protein